MNIKVWVIIDNRDSLIYGVYQTEKQARDILNIIDNEDDQNYLLDYSDLEIDIESLQQ